jgi:hypothetical protein
LEPPNGWFALHHLVAPPAKNTRGWLPEPLGINLGQWSHQMTQRESAIGWLQWLHCKVANNIQPNIHRKTLPRLSHIFHQKCKNVFRTIFSGRKSWKHWLCDVKFETQEQVIQPFQMCIFILYIM